LRISIKYSSTAPERTYADMKCEGIAAQDVGHLIVHGINGRRNNVSSDVDDHGGPYTFDDAKMTFKSAAILMLLLIFEQLPSSMNI